VLTPTSDHKAIETAILLDLFTEGHTVVAAMSDGDRRLENIRQTACMTMPAL
jgi:hypothetical protein